MSGVPTPPVIVEPFCAGGTVGVDYNLIPVPTQVAVSPELASFATGFPPATRTPKGAGGIPPRGLDMNGILRMVSAFCALLQAGQAIPFSSVAATAFGGYKLGATLARTGGGFWYNTVDGNVTDPEGMSPAGWLGWVPTGTGYVSAVLPAGVSTGYVVSASTRVVDLNASGGAAAIHGFSAGYDGQTVTLSSIGTDVITISAGYNVRVPADLAMLQNMSITMVYSVGAGVWIAH